MQMVDDLGEMDLAVAYIIYRTYQAPRGFLSLRTMRTLFLDFLRQESPTRERFQCICPLTPELESAIVDETQVALTVDPLGGWNDPYAMTLAHELADHLHLAHGSLWTLYLMDMVRGDEVARVTRLPLRALAPMADAIIEDTRLWATSTP